MIFIRQYRQILATSMLLLLSVSLAIGSEVIWIKLPLAGGGTLDALLGVPHGTGKHPAVIYSHGTFVRRVGYQGAKEGGYDIRDYVNALIEAGYVALAPVRNIHPVDDPDNVEPGEIMDQSQQQWIEAIDQGIASVSAGIEFLSSHNRVSGPTGLVGFSEGGLVTLWAIIEGAKSNAVVLMSPATIRDAGPRNLKTAKRPGWNDGIKAPILITVGEDDNRSILKGFKGLTKGLKQAGHNFESKNDYPGDHKWFYEVRPEHWKDVRAFLDKYLR